MIPILYFLLDIARVLEPAAVALDYVCAALPLPGTSIVRKSLTMQVPKPTAQFYRRPLPDTCVDFSSERGKVLFTEALAAGNANIYFKLAAQFLTQEEPSFCGLSTLVMVLNALEVDPARIWKGAWRWYHESMLDCCTSLETVKKEGITADQFHCLAQCNRLNVTRYDVPAITTNVNEDERQRYIDDFRQRVLQTVRSDTTILVTSYCRKTLGQTGLGHFSPLAAYNADSDDVLLMDVARFKYPPHWVRVPLLWESMREIDPDTGKPRCYFVLSLNDRLRPMLLLRLADVSMVKGVVEEMEGWYYQSMALFAATDQSGLVRIVVERIANVLLKYSILDVRHEYLVEEEQIGCCSQNCKVTQKQLQQLIQELTEAMEKTNEYQHLVSDDKILDDAGRRRALLTVGLFLSWPFEREKDCTVCSSLAEHCQQTVQKLPASARNEVAVLKRQIMASSFGIADA